MTHKAQAHFDLLTSLEQTAPTIINRQRIWDRPVSVREKIDFLKETAQARATLFRIIEEDHPELKDRSDYTVNRHSITTKE